MEKAIRSLIEYFPKDAFQSFTTDRGKEFSCYPTIKEELETSAYFADPYSSWQRGNNENSNGLLRELFPKRTNFDHVKQDELQSALYLINNRPRKCLGYQTAHDLFKVEVLHLI